MPKMTLTWSSWLQLRQLMVKTAVWVVNNYAKDQRNLYPVAHFTTREAAVAYLGRDPVASSYLIRKIQVYGSAEEKRAEEKEEFRRKALLKLTMEEREVLGLPRLPDARKYGGGQ